jgi:hypothetical protein
MDDLVRVEVGWVCFDVLFFISEFHFLFLLIFILFSRACLYMCNWCFPLRCLFQCSYLFRFYSLFVFIYCLCYVTVLYQFFFESICCSKTRLSYSICLLIRSHVKAVHNRKSIKKNVFFLFGSIHVKMH